LILIGQGTTQDQARRNQKHGFGTEEKAGNGRSGKSFNTYLTTSKMLSKYFYNNFQQ
jgi:hypothetical protein